MNATATATTTTTTVTAPEEGRWISTGQACAKMGVSVEMFYRIAGRCPIRKRQYVGGKPKWWSEDVDKIVAASLSISTEE
jgi:hypothetical protein